MPKCAGCSGSSGCGCLFLSTSSDCISVDVDGTGVLGDEYRIYAYPIIDLDPDNALSCGDGLFVSGGGGGACAEKLMYTVATPGIVALAGYGATPEPFLSCADFVGDGVDDSVAIQAAITASATGPIMVPNVYIHVGVYVVDNALDTQNVRIIGADRRGTILGNSGVVGGAGGTNIINNTASGSPMDISNLSIYATGAAAIVNISGGAAAGNLYDLFIAANGSDSGGDGAFVRLNGIGRFLISNCEFQATTSAGTHDAISMTNGFVPGAVITNNTFFGAGVRCADLTGTIISNNIFNNIYTTNATAPTYCIGMFSCSNSQISDNVLTILQHEGIVLDGDDGPSTLEQVKDNQINSYAISGSVTEDGIRLVQDVDESNIQGNMVRAFLASGRHGINIQAASCDNNFVTNNDLFNSGAGASLNDAGTGTVTAAGNRL